MRRTLKRALYVVALGALGTVPFVRGQAPDWDAADLPVPGLHSPDADQNLGQVWLTDGLRLEFHFLNDSADGIFDIGPIRSAQMFTEVTPDRITLGPGEEATVRAVLDLESAEPPRDEGAPFSETLTVPVKAPFDEEYELTLRAAGAVRAAYAVIPRGLVFGPVTKEDPATADLTIGPLLDEDALEIELLSVPDGVRAEVVQGATGQQDFTVRVAAGAGEPGFHAGKLRFRAITAAGAGPSASVPVSARVVRDIHALPSGLLFGAIRPGAAHSSEVTIRSRGGHPFRVVSAAANDPRVAVAPSGLTPWGQPRYTISISSPTAGPMESAVVFSIRGDSGAEMELRLPVSPYVSTAAPLWVVEPARPAAAQAEDEPLAAVLAAVRAREPAVRTVDCRWVERRFCPKDSLQYAEDLAGDGESGPPADTTVEIEFRMLLGVGSIRYYWRAMDWDGEQGMFVPVQFSGAVRDGEARDLAVDGGWAVISRSGDAQTSIDFRPVLLAYRFLDPELEVVDVERLHLVGRALDRDQECVVLEEEPRNSYNPCELWWLAEDMDYAPVRWQFVKAEGEVLLDCRMEYGDKTDGVWPLRSWQLHETGGTSFVNTVTDQSINGPVDPSEFEITFPPGTHVFDNIHDLDYTVGGVDDPGAANGAEEAGTMAAALPGEEEALPPVPVHRAPPWAAGGRRPAPAVPPVAAVPEEASRAWRWFALVVLAVVIALGLILGRRGRRTT